MGRRPDRPETGGTGPVDPADSSRADQGRLPVMTDPRAATGRATVIRGIGQLVTNDPDAGPGLLGVIDEAAVVMLDGRIAWVGPQSAAPAADDAVDVDGRAALPGWVDSHTHLVFAGDRAAEFTARMAGRPYEAGGINATVTATRAAGDADLRAGLRRLLDAMTAGGTTTVETKTGYGLTVADEARSAVGGRGRGRRGDHLPRGSRRAGGICQERQ